MVHELINRVLAGSSHVLRDPRAELVLDELYVRSQRAADAARAQDAPLGSEQFGDFGFSIRPSQGEFLYLLCRSTKPALVVEFSTSGGAASIYCAAALRDNGCGMVIGSDHRPDRVEEARVNIERAGLTAHTDIRLGDATESLRDIPGPIDVLVVDGWPDVGPPSLALRVLQLVRDKLRPGALILNDGAEPDYLDYVRDPRNGLRTSIQAFGLISVA